MESPRVGHHEWPWLVRWPGLRQRRCGCVFVIYVGDVLRRRRVLGCDPCDHLGCGDHIFEFFVEAATSLGGDSVDQRLPTRRTSPQRSRACSLASALSVLIPAARAAIAVENEPGSLRSASLGDPNADRARGPPGTGSAARAAQP